MPPLDYVDDSRPDRVPPEELGQAIQTFKFPSERDKLVAHAREEHAPATIVRALEDLPSGEYRNPDQVVEAYDEVTRLRD